MPCSPEFPFGCPESWGSQVFANWTEFRKHVCNLEEHHEGQHECACGERIDGPVCPPEAP